MGVCPVVGEYGIPCGESPCDPTCASVMITSVLDPVPVMDPVPAPALVYTGLVILLFDGEAHGICSGSFHPWLGDCSCMLGCLGYAEVVGC